MLETIPFKVHGTMIQVNFILFLFFFPLPSTGCEDCGQSHMGDCPVHGPLLRVRDKVIPSRARLTLPHYLVLKEMELRTGNQQGKRSFLCLLNSTGIPGSRALHRWYKERPSILYLTSRMAMTLARLLEETPLPSHG